MYCFSIVLLMFCFVCNLLEDTREVFEEDIFKAMKLKLNNVEQIWKEQHEGRNKFKYCNFVYIGAYANSVLDSLIK